MRLHRIAGQSDGSEFDYFKQTLLQPFLIKRVPDTDGNRQVQQARCYFDRSPSQDDKRFKH